MKIAFFEIKPWEKRYLKGKLKDHTLLFFKEQLGDINLSQIKDIDALSVFIYSNVTKEIISNLPKLKLVATRSTGFDHIDLKECKKKKITVCNVPFYGENTVAEHTFALILSLSRSIHKSYLRTIKDDFSIDGLTGFDLRDKTIGIIGGGHIGMHVARMARAFSMHVRVFDINRNNFLSEVVNYQYVGIDELLRTSDIISLHVPHNKSTHHMINKESIKKMKKGAILINTARGGLVNTDDMLEALEKNRLAGAGLDVIEGEDIIKEESQCLHHPESADKCRVFLRDHRIFHMDNVVFTPHNAFNSKEALIRILDTTIENLNTDNKKIVE